MSCPSECNILLLACEHSSTFGITDIIQSRFQLRK